MPQLTQITNDTLITGFYRPRKLGLSFPRLYDIPEGEAMASALLQVN